MADIKISALDEAQTAETGDYVIINKDDTSTEKINVSKLFSTPISGDAYYAAQYHPFTAVWTPKEYGVWNNRGSLFDVGTSETVTATMPEGSDSAIVYYFFFDGWSLISSTPQVSTASYFRQYTSHDLTVGNATWVTGDAKDTMGCVVTHNICFVVNSTTILSSNRQANIPAVKFDAITFNKAPKGGTPVTFKVSVDLLKGGYNRWNTNYGRVVVIPFDSSKTTLSLPQNDDTQIHFNLADKETALNTLFPPLTEKELAEEQSAQLTGQFKNLLDNLAGVYAATGDSGTKDLIDEIYAYYSSGGGSDSVETAQGKFATYANSVKALTDFPMNFIP